MSEYWEPLYTNNNNTYIILCAKHCSKHFPILPTLLLCPFSDEKNGAERVNTLPKFLLAESNRGLNHCTITLGHTDRKNLRPTTSGAAALKPTLGGRRQMKLSNPGQCISGQLLEREAHGLSRLHHVSLNGSACSLTPFVSGPSNKTCRVTQALNHVWLDLANQLLLLESLISPAISEEK